MNEEIINEIRARAKSMSPGCTFKDWMVFSASAREDILLLLAERDHYKARVETLHKVFKGAVTQLKSPCSICKRNRARTIPPCRVCHSYQNWEFDEARFSPRSL